jgi:hypothetical protein
MEKKELDAQTAERISALAKSLKDLHLAATMEEAYNRAREILLGAKKEQTADFKTQETIGELMKDEIEQKRKQEELKKAVGGLEVYEKKKEAESKETEKEIKEVEQELAAEEHEIEEIKEVAEEAEEAEKSGEETSEEN